MTILNERESLIIIVDIQEKLLNAAFNKDTLKNKASILAHAASILKIPVIITEQYPKGLGETIPELKSVLGEDTMYFEKTSFSALENIGIANAIDKSGKKQILILGIETHICVSQTANALIKKGYDVTFIKDASGSRKAEEHEAGIERMKDNGIHVITTEIAIFEWLKSSKHTNFKEVQQLIK